MRWLRRKEWQRSEGCADGTRTNGPRTATGGSLDFFNRRKSSLGYGKHEPHHLRVPPGAPECHRPSTHHIDEAACLTGRIWSGAERRVLSKTPGGESVTRGSRPTAHHGAPHPRKQPQLRAAIGDSLLQPLAIPAPA